MEEVINLGKPEFWGYKVTTRHSPVNCLSGHSNMETGSQATGNATSEHSRTTKRNSVQA